MPAPSASTVVGTAELEEREHAMSQQEHTQTMDSTRQDGEQRNKLALALASLAAGAAAMPVAAFINTFLGLALAALSVYFVSMA